MTAQKDSIGISEVRVDLIVANGKSYQSLLRDRIIGLDFVHLVS